jgi:hypothetical protein
MQIERRGVTRSHRAEKRFARGKVLAAEPFSGVDHPSNPQVTAGWRYFVTKWRWELGVTGKEKHPNLT